MMPHIVHAEAISRTSIVAWGRYEEGQLAVPTGLTNAKALAAGIYHTVALKEDGTVAAWGDNSYGQTTVPANLANVKAIAAGGYFTAALKEDGTIAEWGDNSCGQTTVPANLTNVKAIAAGIYHTAALKEDGTVVVWGLEGQGQTMVPAGLSNVKAIASGSYHIVALKEDGTVVEWGGNDFSGKIRVPEGLTNVKAIAAGYQFTAALKEDGTIVTWGLKNQTTGGPETIPPPPVPAGLTNVTAIAAGYDYIVALKEDGTVVAFGNNALGKTTVPEGLANVKLITAGLMHIVTLVDNQDQLAPTGLSAVTPTTYWDSDGRITGVTTLMEYKPLTGNSYSAVTGTEVADLAAGTYNVRFAARPGYNEGADATVVVENGPNADQASPKGVTGVSPSTYGGADGRITGVTTLMEYKPSTADNYSAVTGAEITGLPAGTYNVRYASKIDYNQGEDAVIIVGDGPFSGPAKGNVQNGWSLENNLWYYYQNGIKVKNGWKLDSHGWCFLNAIDGSWVQEGWAKDSHGWGYLRSGYWVDHATWVKDSHGWCYIGANGYYDSSVAYKATNPLEDAAKLVEKALETGLQDDIDAARSAVVATKVDEFEQAPLLARLEQN